MGGQAVLAAVRLGHGERELLAELRPERAAAQRGAEAEIAVEDGGRDRHRSHHVGREAELGLDGAEQVLCLASRFSRINRCQPCHSACLLGRGHSGGPAPRSFSESQRCRRPSPLKGNQDAKQGPGWNYWISCSLLGGRSTIGKRELSD